MIIWNYTHIFFLVFHRKRINIFNSFIQWKFFFRAHTLIITPYFKLLPPPDPPKLLFRNSIFFEIAQSSRLLSKSTVSSSGSSTSHRFQHRPSSSLSAGLHVYSIINRNTPERRRRAEQDTGAEDL